MRTPALSRTTNSSTCSGTREVVVSIMLLRSHGYPPDEVQDLTYGYGTHEFRVFDQTGEMRITYASISARALS